MKNIYTIFLFFILSINFLKAQTAPKREMRGAWIATYANIDWPSSTATTAQEQSSFIQRLDEHKATGMNAIFAQVRSQCDALYPSPNEPWSAIISGTQGVAPNPYYDPLLFMINETKQRGMEFHAWFNPYRALASFTTTTYNNLAATHVAKLHPDWTMVVTNITGGAKQILLNPGAPEVWEHIIGSIMHVVRNYDVDGIHFDDYFYTNPATTTYNDDSVYAIHNRGIVNRGDWRRSNVDSLIKRLSDSIKSVKPWIKFGISPSGIWMSQANEVGGSNTSAGALQHKKDLYANTRLWLQQGWIDYLAPQVYWYIGQSGSDYNLLAPWWSTNNFGRHIYMGQAGYKVGDAAQNAAFASDNTQIPRQVRLDRSLAGISGQIIYNTTSLRNNPLKFRDSLRLNFYNKPALLPTMAWKDNIAPNPASNLTASMLVNNTISLSWINPTSAVAAAEMDVVKRFAIYKGVNIIPDINNPDQLIAITNTDVSSYIDTAVVSPNTTYNYVITAIDRLYNESAASNTATVAVGALPLNLISFDVQKTTGNIALVKWETANEINTDYFDVEKAFDNNNFKKILSTNANDGSVYYNYNFTDYNLKQNGTYYYRLKMVDKDGAFTLSTIKKITINNANNELSVYPNPITKGNRLQLIWPNVNGNISYNLMATNGKTVIQGNIQFYGGVANIVLSNNLAIGNYILQCFKNGKMHNLKIIVQ
jgi:uncharacterized lipoprotein YddW (UPF0748 family)